MALMPRKVKFRKAQKGKNRGLSTRNNSLVFGEYGLKALENGLIKCNQIEACRLVIARKMRGAGRLWISIFPDLPKTKKPAETRMGKGKGDPDHWVARIKRGRMIFEMSGVPEEFAKQILRLAAFKLPVRTCFITRAAH